MGISSMPDAVVGGMTTFLFCNVFVSGLSVVSKADLNSRRNRIILAISMGVGLGVTAVPWIFGDQREGAGTAPFWACTGPFREGADCNKGERGIRDGILILLPRRTPSVRSWPCSCTASCRLTWKLSATAPMLVKRNIPHGIFRSPKEKPSLPAAFNNECAFSKRKRFENDDAIKTYTYINNKKKKRKREASLCRDKVKRKREREREKKNRLLLLYRFSAVKIIYYYYDTCLI